MKREHKSDYIILNYLQSNNGSYIDTNYKIASNNVNVEVDYCQLGDTTIANQYFVIFGSLAVDYQSGKFGFGAAQRFQHPSVGSGVNLTIGRNEFNVLNGITLNSWHNLKLSSNGSNWNINIDNGSKTYNGYQYGQIANNTPTIVFAMRNWGTSIANGLQIARFKLTQDNILRLDLVPKLRTLDSKPGLYDNVNGVFYTNQGSGEFLYA